MTGRQTVRVRNGVPARIWNAFPDAFGTLHHTNPYQPTPEFPH